MAAHRLGQALVAPIDHRRCRAPQTVRAAALDPVRATGPILSGPISVTVRTLATAPALEIGHARVIDPAPATDPDLATAPERATDLDQATVHGPVIDLARVTGRDRGTDPIDPALATDRTAPTTIAFAIDGTDMTAGRSRATGGAVIPRTDPVGAGTQDGGGIPTTGAGVTQHGPH